MKHVQRKVRSQTPQTDKAESVTYVGCERIVPSDFARGLEIQLRLGKRLVRAYNLACKKYIIGTAGVEKIGSRYEQLIAWAGVKEKTK